MRRRLGRPSLLRTAARTAVIAGTATATMNAVGGASRREPAAPQAAQPAPAPAASGLTEETLAKLKQVGELHAAGVLDDNEFSQAKAKLLA
jgi:hypothetical protein